MAAISFRRQCVKEAANCALLNSRLDVKTCIEIVLHFVITLPNVTQDAMCVQTI